MKKLLLTFNLLFFICCFLACDNDISENQNKSESKIYEIDFNNPIKLSTKDKENSDFFGTSIAMEGDSIVIGAREEGRSQKRGNGSIYVFNKKNANWSQTQKIILADGKTLDYFGHSVAISKQVIAVGAYKRDNNGTTNNGAVYIFTYDNGTWSKSQELLANDKENHDAFGYSLAMQNDILVVGARGNNNNGMEDSGAVYVFTKDGDSWKQSQKLLAKDKKEYSYFGNSVAIDDEVIVVGADYESSDGVNRSGAVYVFTKNGNSWNQSQKLSASDKKEKDYFGFSVSIYNEIIVIGAKSGDSGNKNGNGVAYIFSRNSDSWSETQKLMANDMENADRFGAAVAIYGNTIIVGADHKSDEGKASLGATYIFKKNGNDWQQTQKLLSTDRPSNAYFGFPILIDKEMMVVGARGDDENGKTLSGAIYVYGQLEE